MSYPTAPIGMVFSVANGATPKSGEEDLWDGDIPWITPADLGKNGAVEIANGVRSITREGLSSCGTQIVPAGSIVLSIRAPIGHTAIAARPMCFNQGCRGLVPSKQILSKFGYWAILSAIPALRSVGQGTTFQELSRDKLRTVRLPLPDLATQRQIADFLDRETARIDLLIEKKQRFINVLAQKWAAIVTFTLTNGLNSDAPKRDSGVSWIDEIPEHWSVAKLGHIGRSANGINIGGDAFGSGFPFVSYGDVYRNPELPRTVKGLVQSSTEDRARYSLKAGDVLFTRTSEIIDEIGFSSVCMEDMPGAVFAGFLIRFRPMKGKLVPSFAKFLFRNERLRAFFSKEMMIVTRASLSQSLLQRMPVVLPPIEEQKEIAQYLQKAEDTFGSVSEKTKTSIDRLKEYRSALITAAVTGQIDVQTYAKSGGTDRQLDAIQEEMGG